MRGQVSKRLKWEDTVPFPGNPIYAGRLRQMVTRWGGYKHELIGTPEIFDNAAGAFPELSRDALIMGDGNHRCALAREYKALDQEFVAVVWQGLTRKEMYKLREASGDRRTVKPAERFLSAVERFPDGVERRVLDDVAGTGWHISYEREDHGLPSTNELTWIWRQNRGAMIRAIQTYEAAFGIKPVSGQGTIIKGAGAFWVEYPHADFDRLIRSLRGVTAAKLHTSAQEQHMSATFIKTVYDGVRFSLAMGYNRVGRSGRLEL